MIDPKKINEALPSHKLVNHEGTLKLRNPKDQVVAKYDSRTGIFEIDGDHADHDKVIKGLQEAGMNIEIKRKPNPKPEKIQNFGNLDKYLNALKGVGGVGDSSSSITFNSDGNVVFATNNYQNAQVLKHRFYNVSAARVDGNIAAQRFEITVPLEFFKTFKEIIQ